MRQYKTETKEVILTTTFSTPLGEMFAASSKKGIVMLCFFTPFNIEAKIQTLKNTLDAEVIPGNSEIFDVLKIQLEEYFNKKRKIFEIPFQLIVHLFKYNHGKHCLIFLMGKLLVIKNKL